MIKIENDLVDGVDFAGNHKDFDTLQTKCHKVVCEDMEKRRLYKRLVLLLTKPSYTLALGSKNARHENRTRLRHLLFKLVRQHSWVEASGVLSTLLKGTCKESSLLNNRRKYSIAMELLRQMENDANAYSKNIKRLYNEIWEKKIHSYKHRPLKDRHVELESILSCLTQNNLDSAIQTVRRLQQQRESESDPKSNLIMGVAYYEVWCSGLRKELQKSNVDVGWTSIESETVGNNSYDLVEGMKGDDAASIYETYSNLHYHSETSVINEKKISGNCNDHLNGDASEANIILPVEHHKQFRSQGFYMNSIETSGEDDGSFQCHFNKMHGYVSSVHGLQSLLPLRLPSLDFLSSYRSSLHDLYKHALKYLKLALHSPPPVSEAALLPLIQLLLLGDHVNEALNILEKSCNELSSVLPCRLRARLWECFDANNFDKLSACFENVLKKDPTCRQSLARLLHMHLKGDYASERLVEMIALHLEATYADNNTWREFASCLLKLSHSEEEDRTSVCMNGEQVENEQIHAFPSRRIPVMFVVGVSGKTWKLRCKWWLNRHFSKDILTCDMAAGDSQLMIYKAACASHLYGNEMEYVLRVLKHVQEHDRTMSTYLHMHIQNSIGFFSNLVRTRVV